MIVFSVMIRNLSITALAAQLITMKKMRLKTHEIEIRVGCVWIVWSRFINNITGGRTGVPSSKNFFKSLSQTRYMRHFNYKLHKYMCPKKINVDSRYILLFLLRHYELYDCQVLRKSSWTKNGDKIKSGAFERLHIWGCHDMSWFAHDLVQSTLKINGTL